MDKNFGRIFGAGLVVVALIVGFVFFAKRGDHLQPKGSIVKVRSIDLDEETSLLVLDVRLVNDSTVTMTTSAIDISVELADGSSVVGMILGKADLKGTFKYFPLLGEQFNETLALRDEIPAKSKVDRMIAASFNVPLAKFDARKRITVKISDASGTAAEFTGR